MVVVFNFTKEEKVDWLIYVSIFIVIVVILRRTSKTGRAKRLANKLVYNFYLAKGQTPKLDEVDLYRQTVQVSPLHYSEERFEEIVKFAHSLSEKRDGVLDAKVDLLWLITAVCIVEIGGANGQISGHLATRMYQIAYSSVPSELR